MWYNVMLANYRSSKDAIGKPVASDTTVGILHQNMRQHSRRRGCQVEDCILEKYEIQIL